MVEKFRFNAGDAVVWHNLLAKYECTIGMIVANPADGSYVWVPATDRCRQGKKSTKNSLTSGQIKNSL